MFIKHCLTGSDNTTWDVGRVLWVIIVIVGLGLVIASFITGKTFDLEHYGIGSAAMLAAGAGALKIKETTEPQP